MAPDVVFERSTREATQMVHRLASASGPLRGAVVRFALGRARQLGGIREMPKNNLILALAAVRRNLWAVGEALATEGRIDEAGDIFWLSIAEARAGLSGSSLVDVVAPRRESYHQELRRRRVPRVMLSDGTEPEATTAADAATCAAADAGDLSGVAASPGTVTGTVRVILDPVGAQLEPGEILVAPSRDPGWTPLFLTAGGLVMEMGGPNSHGAVVAREYGIPAVVGVPLATDHLSTGDVVTVNGTAGTVTVAQRDPAVSSARSGTA
jgi:phosphohistidine swiveling domain-containing protein